LHGKPLCSVISAGCSRYGKREGLSGSELLNEALEELFENCPKLRSKSIKAVYLGQGFESFEHKANTGAGFANNFGIENVPAVRIDTVSSSGAAALRQGVLGIMSGSFDIILCAGVEKMTSKSTEEALEIIAMAADRPFEQWNGATLTSLNALVAREHMRKYGTTEEQMALVAVKNHRNALENPKAYLRKAVTVQDVLSSRKICTPLKLLDSSPICDGASCVALCNAELAKKFTDSPIDVIGSGEASDSEFIFRGGNDITSFTATKMAVREALGMADKKIGEMDLLELHDAFTINELIAYEDLGLCGRGESGRYVESGATELCGRNPVNTSGGLKAKGHPIGSSGTGQVYEIYTQFLGQTDPARSVKNAALGLTHSMGGAGVTAEVHVFQNR
jgi:acetyl-CoA C-acetyltransferase